MRGSEGREIGREGEREGGGRELGREGEGVREGQRGDGFIHRPSTLTFYLCLCGCKKSWEHV